LILFWMIRGDKPALATAINKPKKNDATMSNQLCVMKY